MAVLHTYASGQFKAKRTPKELSEAAQSNPTDTSQQQQKLTREDVRLQTHKKQHVRMRFLLLADFHNRLRHYIRHYPSHTHSHLQARTQTYERTTHDAMSKKGGQKNT